MANYDKVTDLVAEAQNLCDETADNKIWIEWFNNALDDLADVLYLDKYVKLTGKGVYPVPEDLLAVIVAKIGNHKVSRLNNSDYTGKGYRIMEGNIVLQGYGNEEIPLDLYYYRSPQYFTTQNTSIVDLPKHTTRAVIYFGCAQCMLREDEPERYLTFMDMYGAAKLKIEQYTKKNRQGRFGTWGVVR